MDDATDSPTVACAECGMATPAKSRNGSPKRFCSQKCRVRNHGAKGRTKTCEVCGKDYRTQWAYQRACGRSCGKFLEAQSTGTDRCGVVYETPIVWNTCYRCGDEFVAEKPLRQHRRSCVERTAADKARYVRERNRRIFGLVPPIQSACPECGAAFMPTKWHRPSEPRQQYCTDECARRALHRTRRHRERVAQRTGERFTLREIAERDGWRCHLCRRKITTLGQQEKLSGTLDHLNPVSKDGAHTRANVALACRSCNSRRGAGLIPAQLRLIG